MRYLFALVALSLAACSSDPAPPQTDAGGAVDLGVADSAPCGGACGPGTVCESGRCVAVDAGAPSDVTGDAGADASDSGGDAASRCSPSTLVICTTEPFGEGCWDLQTSNGRVPAVHCGMCNRACPAAAPECVAGRCTAP